VLVVWEPILVTDWRAPSRSTLGRLSDARVQQFWDPKHEVSKALNRMANSSSSEPRPNSGRGFYWDEAIVYGLHSKWKDEPTPLFWLGPVYQVMPDLGTALGGTVPQTPQKRAN
jgi:hypothetical protein